MRVWAVANQKGGVGKTTTAVNLAGLCANRGYRTLLIDMDPHGSLTSYFGFDPESISPSAYHLFGEQRREQAEAAVRETQVERLSILPASTALATLDRQLGHRPGLGLVIRHTLQDLADRFDYALLDCPPMLGVLMVNALAACDELLVPVQTEFLALKGLERMVNTLNMIQRSRQSPLAWRIVPTMFDRRTRASVDSLEELRASYGEQIWTAAIPIDTQFREASREGLPLTVSQPWSRGSQAYRRLLDDLLQEIAAPAEKGVENAH